jgi:hypothetical protein
MASLFLAQLAPRGLGSSRFFTESSRCDSVTVAWGCPFRKRSAASFIEIAGIANIAKEIKIE